MKITTDTITVAFLRDLRVSMARACMEMFDLQTQVDNSRIDPQGAADRLREILTPVQMEVEP